MDLTVTSGSKPLVVREAAPAGRLSLRLGVYAAAGITPRSSSTWRSTRLQRKATTGAAAGGQPARLPLRHAMRFDRRQ